MNLSHLTEDELTWFGLFAERVGWQEQSDLYFAELIKQDVNPPLREAA